MSRKIVVPEGLTPSPNPLSPGVVVGGLLFASGQTAAEESGIEAQTRAVLDRLGTVLRAAGADYGNVVRCGVYLADVTQFAQMNAVYKEYFPSDFPARSTIVCPLVRPDILVEIDCVAEVP